MLTCKKKVGIYLYLGTIMNGEHIILRYVMLVEDVLRYLKEYKVPYSSIYGDIVENDDGSLRTTG